MHFQGGAAKVTDFGAFHDREAYNMKLFGVHFWARIHREQVDKNMRMYTRSMQMIGGEILKGDHSFKTSKLIMVQGQKPYEAIYTLQNGENEIVGCWCTKGSSMEELRDVLGQVASRFKKHGFQGPLIWYTDNCCHEESFLKTVIHPATTP